jgi:hypothetical protein
MSKTQQFMSLRAEKSSATAKPGIGFRASLRAAQKLEDNARARLREENPCWTDQATPNRNGFTGL